MSSFRAVIRPLLALLALLPAASPLAANGLLCLEQQKTGYTLNTWSREWEIAKFANLKRFVIRAPTAAEAAAQPARVWMVAEEGHDFAIAECLKDFSSTGVLECNGDLEFVINKETARFQVVQNAGYAMGHKGERVADGQLTPYFSIGGCTGN